MIVDPSGRIIIYDAFIRNNVLTLISTYYHKDEPAVNILVDGVAASEHGRNAYEPMRWFKAPVTGVPTEITINGIVYPLQVSIIEATQRGIAIATLFKGDYKHIPAMLDFYRKQGVTYFYLFYNGPRLPDGLPIADDIHYGLWDFKYWNIESEHVMWRHHAQTTFLSMITNKYMADHTWLGLIDIDEFIYPTAGVSLVKELTNSPSDVVAFLNHWAKLENGIITYVAEGLPYPTRSKCFYRGSFSEGIIGIHYPRIKKSSVYISSNLKMLHIVTLSHHDKCQQRLKFIEGSLMEVPLL